MITVQDIFLLPYYKEHNITFLSGESGSGHEVKAVNLIQLFTFDQWMRGGEILLVNGIGLHLERPENITRIIQKAAAKDVAGIIFLKNHFLPSIPAEALQLSNEIGFPLLWVPEEPPFSECISVIYEFISQKDAEKTNTDDLVRNLLLYDSVLDATLVYEQLDALGFTYDGVRVLVFRGEIEDDAALSEKEWEPILHSLAVSLEDRYQERILSMIRSNRLILFLPMKDAAKVKDLVLPILTVMQKNYPHVYFKVGCGNYYKELVDYRESYQEACRCHKVCESKQSHLLFYEELGLLRLCMDITNPEVITEYIQGVLGKLIAYDQQNQTDLLHTLSVLIDCHFNISKAAQELYIHRNTMIQRTDKIKTILDTDLENATTRRELSSATYLAQYFDVQPEHHSQMAK